MTFVSKLKYPKMKNAEKWAKIDKYVTKVLVDTKVKLLSLDQLSTKLYESVKRIVPRINIKKKSSVKPFNHFTERERLINLISTKNKKLRPTCSNKTLADWFMSLNETDDFSIDLSVFDKDIGTTFDAVTMVSRKSDIKIGFTQKQIQSVLDKRQNNKSNHDGLCYELIRRNTDLQNILLKHFNQIIETKTIPKSWYIGRAYGFHKGKGESDNPKSFRPIVCFNTFSKLFWHLVSDNMMNHILDPEHGEPIINTEIQKAYLPNMRGVEESIHLNQYLSNHADLMVYLDLENAFGTLHPNFLKYVLQFYKFNEQITDILVDFMINRKIYVGEEVRNWNCGVSQGMSISNLIFILCINLILDTIQSNYMAKYGVKIKGLMYLLQAFADDITLVGNNVPDTQIVLNKLVHYFKCAGLKLQPKKCFVVNHTTNNDLHINNMILQRIDDRSKNKHLGQYLSIRDLIDPMKAERRVFEKFSDEINDEFTQITELLSNNLPSYGPRDYMYCYHTLYKNRITWFLRCRNLVQYEALYHRYIVKKIEQHIINISTDVNRLTKAKVQYSKCLNSSNDLRIISMFNNMIATNPIYIKFSNTTYTTLPSYKYPFYFV